MSVIRLSYTHSFSLLSAIMVVFSTYLVDVSPACLDYNSSSQAFLMMCSAYRLNKQRLTADCPVVLLSLYWKKEELKSLLMRVKEESERASLRLNIEKTKIMASGPIIVWQIKGGKVETVTDFLYLGSKITVDGDHSHEIRR